MKLLMGKSFKIWTWHLLHHWINGTWLKMNMKADASSPLFSKISCEMEVLSKKLCPDYTKFLEKISRNEMEFLKSQRIFLLMGTKEDAEK